MNNFYTMIIKKIGLLPIIKRLLRRWWGKYPCMCGEPPKSAIGFTMDRTTRKITHFWCAECGGYRETKGKYRIEIGNHKEGGGYGA